MIFQHILALLLSHSILFHSSSFQAQLQALPFTLNYERKKLTISSYSTRKTIPNFTLCWFSVGKKNLLTIKMTRTRTQLNSSSNKRKKRPLARANEKLLLPIQEKFIVCRKIFSKGNKKVCCNFFSTFSFFGKYWALKCNCSSSSVYFIFSLFTLKLSVISKLFYLYISFAVELSFPFFCHYLKFHQARFLLFLRQPLQQTKIKTLFFCLGVSS